MPIIRKPLIAGNWKMHNTVEESVQLANAVKQGLANTEADVLIAPSFTALKAVCEAVRGSEIFVAAQDCFWEEKGAFTGAVSPLQVKNTGCTHVIIGHSEKRKIFGDTNEIINKKIKAAFKEKLFVIFCIGETLEERQAEKTYQVLENQISKGLLGFSAEELASLVIAYEPVWAIGTGQTATPAQAQNAHAYIRQYLNKTYGAELSEKIKILYGGSVKPENIKNIMAQPDIDGALVGGESLKADRFLEIVHFQKNEK